MTIDGMKGRRVLVTGAGGFIGSHLVEELAGAGVNVTAFLRYDSRASIGNLRHLPAETLESVAMVHGDVRDPGSVLEAMRGQDVAFHLAALIGIPYSYQAPRSYVDTNVVGTLNVLEAARTLGTERVVHTSTSEVYGTALTVPIAEGHPLQAQSPYSASKIAADKLAESYHRSFGTPVVTLRPFNCYGPRQSARAVIPTIIGQLLSGDGDVRLGLLSPRRDFTFVLDTVRAFMLAATTDEAVGKTVNAGSGNDIAIGDLADKLATRIGRGGRVTSTGERVRPKASEVMRLVADGTLAKSLLGWEPSMSLTQGLMATARFFADNPDALGDPKRYAR